MTIIVIRGNPDDSAGTMNKKCPQMLVAFFRHIHQHLPVATRMLAWNQTQPCSKSTATDQKREAVVFMCDAIGLSQRRVGRLTGLSCLPAVMTLSVHLQMHIYQGVSLSWRLNEGILIIGASGSYCVGRAFTSITCCNLKTIPVCDI